MDLNSILDSPIICSKWCKLLRVSKPLTNRGMFVAFIVEKVMLIQSIVWKNLEPKLVEVILERRKLREEYEKCTSSSTDSYPLHPPDCQCSNCINWEMDDLIYFTFI